ncbi:MAG: hypothetical protein HC843_12720 [Sphingomonadales bacterium]|nr:hypothetical protein [Sphingomonadales bacterium]
MSAMTEADIALAGEYVLGLLDNAAQAQAEARMASDPLFAREVENWRNYLVPMVMGQDETPPAFIWEKISGTVSASKIEQDNPKRPHFWRYAGIAGGGIAAALAAILFLQSLPDSVPDQEAGEESFAEAAAERMEAPNEAAADAAAAAPAFDAVPANLAASIVGADGKYRLTARYDNKAKQMLINAQALNVAPLYPEVWIVPKDGKARSLGLVAAKGESRLVIASDMQKYIYEGAAIVITPEPEGGAPGGVATGPAIATGKLVQS